MKNKFPLLLLALLILSCSKDDDPEPEEPTVVVIEDKVFDGNLSFQTQEEIDGFAEEGNYTVIKGSVMIGSQDYGTPTLDISGLGTLRKIEGELRIYKTTEVNMGSLKNLDTVMSFMQIAMNDQLRSISGVSNLKYVGDWFNIGANHKMVDFTSTPNITYINKLELYGNGGLKSLDGISNIKEIGEGISITRHPNLIDYCDVKELIKESNIFFHSYENSNGYNPPKEDILNGNCKK